MDSFEMIVYISILWHSYHEAIYVLVQATIVAYYTHYRDRGYNRGYWIFHSNQLGGGFGPNWGSGYNCGATVAAPQFCQQFLERPPEDTDSWIQL